MRDKHSKHKIFSRRAFFIGVCKSLLFGALGFRYYYLQLMESQKYRVLADNNRIKLQVTAPLRGIVLDRYNDELVTNRLSYKVVLDRGQAANIRLIIYQLSHLLDSENQPLSAKDIKKAAKALSKNGQIVLKDSISWQDIAKIEESIDLAGTEIIQEQRRNYLGGETLAHITGYIAKPSEQEVLNASIPNYQEFQVGKNGIEKTFNQELLGTPGMRKIEVNSLGQFVRELSNIKSIPASALQLSIDYKIQQIIARHLKDLCGAALLLDVNSGEVLGMHSTPAYDPNHFIGGISLAEWRKIADDPNKPLINKAISTPYPPGSTFKIVTALAILIGGISPYKKVMCTGSYSFGGRIFRCWKKEGHGAVNLEEAITGSCNVYFYTQGLQVGISTIAQTAKLLGLGTASGIELPFEHGGLVPDKVWTKQKLSKVWQHGDTINTSIGQGYVMATPIQLAVLLARITTGRQVHPTIVHDEYEKKFPLLNVSPTFLEIIKYGLYKVFNHPNGTGYHKRRIYANGVCIAGKTGTAQVVALKRRGERAIKEAHRDHGIFAGFFPAINPKFAITTVIEHGGWGSKSALPVAQNIIGDVLDVI